MGCATHTGHRYGLLWVCACQKDKDLHSDVKSEDEDDDDESTTSILVVEPWRGQMAIIVLFHLIEC